MTFHPKQLEIISLGIDSELKVFIGEKSLSEQELSDAEKIFHYLRHGFGDGVYERVLRYIKYGGLRENSDVVILNVQNDLIKGVIIQGYFKEIASFIYDNCKLAKKIELAVKVGKKVNTEVIQISPEAVLMPDRYVEDLKKDCLIDESFRFDNFVHSNSNQLAYWSARQVSEMILNNDFNSVSSLCLFGSVGMGKTHLMKSIMHYVKKTKSDCKIEYISAEDLKEHYVNAVRQNSLYRFKKRFSDLDALLIDDAQFISSTTGSIEKEFSRILNSFVDNRKWIVVACDRSPLSLKIDERTRSRISSGLKASIQQSDFNLRIMILRAKLEQMYQSYEIPLNLIEYIAQNVIHSIRELESILQSIIRYATVMKTRVIRESIVHEIVTRSDIDITPKIDNHLHHITNDDIIKIICEFYTIKKSDLLGSSRVKKVSRARAAAAYVARNNTSMTLKAIGEMLDRKHSTIMYLINSVTEDKSLLSEINNLQMH